MAAPALELGAIEGRMADLLARYCDLDDACAYAMASAGLSDWQVERALFHEREEGMFYTAAIYEALQDTGPLPVVIAAPAVPAALPVPLPALAPEMSAGQRLLSTIQSALCYSVVVDYIGSSRATPIPVGVIVLCPGLKYAQACFYRPNIPLLPRSRRWKRVDASINNLTRVTPTTLEALEDEIRCQHSLLPARQRVFRFREVQARITNPYRFTTKLYGEVVFMSSIKALEKTEKNLEQVIDLLTCPDCGEEEHSGPCRMTTHRMILRHVDRMDEDETGYWLDRVQAELPSTSHQLAVQLLARRCSLLAKGNPEKAAELNRFFGIAQDILSI